MKKNFFSYTYRCIISLLIFVVASYSICVLADGDSELHGKTKSNDLHGVSTNDPFEGTPDEILVEIAKKLDLNAFASFSKVSSRFRAISADPSVLEAFDSLIVENLSQLHQFPRLVFDLTLTRKEIIKKQLLNDICQKDIVTLQKLISAKKADGNFDPNRTYVAAFLAKYIINLVTVGAIVEPTAEKLTKASIGNVGWLHFSNYDLIISHNETDTALVSGIQNVKNAFSNSDWRFAKISVESAALNSLWREAAKIAMDSTVMYENGYNYASIMGAINQDTQLTSRNLSIKLAHSNLTDIGVKAYYVSELMTLHWLAQNNSRFFNLAFERAYQSLHSSIEINQAKEAIFRRLQGRRSSQNLFILELKEFLDKAEKLIRAEQSDSN